MKRNTVVTKDGSHTIAVPLMNVTYHSVHGAVQESRHVFIEAGLHHVMRRSGGTAITVFEMGFGTGLNALLTAVEAGKTATNIHYTAVETSPLSLEEATVLNYPAMLGHADLFQRLHQCEWNKTVRLASDFTIDKRQTGLVNFLSGQPFNLIYYDAFAPSAQPELWTKEVFDKLFSMLDKGGVLVTYCSKGDVRRAMTAAGFSVEKIPGPPGKREMMRAEKITP